MTVQAVQPAPPTLGQSHGQAYGALDLVRAIAALAVVWNHAWNMAAGPMPSGAGWVVHAIYITAGFGPDAVFAFFVVSGFWIGKSVSGRLASGRWSWPHYLADRLSRLLIVLVPALLLGAMLDLVGSWLLGLPAYQHITVIAGEGFPIDATLNWPTFLANLLFLQGVFAHPFGSNVALWSLSYEFWYYIWIPVILKLRYRVAIRLPELCVTVISMIVMHKFLPFFPIWLLGCAIYLLCHERSAAAAAPLGVGMTVIAAAIWLTAIAIAHALDVPLLVSGYMLALGAIPLMALAGRLRLPDSRALRWLADYGANRSFSLYAMHFPVLLLLIALLPAGARNPADALIVAPACALICVLSALLFARVTEARTAQLRRWIYRRIDQATGFHRT